MDLQKSSSDRVLCLHAAAKRLQIPERTLRYRASRGRIEGAFKAGKLWKFWGSALERIQPSSAPRQHALLIACILLTGFACSSTYSAGRHSPLITVDQRKPAPGLALKDADGKLVKIGDYRGKVVLLDFWATWCGPCKIEEPWLKEFERTYKERGFAILAVSMDEDGWDIVKPYIQEKKINYRVLMATAEVDRLFPGLEAWPTSYLIDRHGRIAWTHIGLAPKKDFEVAIEELLQE